MIKSSGKFLPAMGGGVILGNAGHTLTMNTHVREEAEHGEGQQRCAKEGRLHQTWRPMETDRIWGNRLQREANKRA